MWRDFIQVFAQSSAGKIAIVDDRSGRRLTYADLHRESEEWRGWLLGQGVTTGDRVAFLAPNRLEHLTLFFACNRIGAIFVPLNHRLAAGELADIIDRVQPACFVGEGAAPFPHPVYQSIDSLDPAPKTTRPPVPVTDDQPLLMLFTSGTTGRPKGVLLQAGMLMANMHHTVASDVLRPEDISIANTPFFHTGGYNVFTLPLLSIGGTLILFERFDPGSVLKAIDREGITVFWGVPTMFQALRDHVDFSRTDFSRIRFFLSGGAPLSPPLIQAFHQRGIPFKQGFGLTEVGPNCFLHETEDAFERPDATGKPMAHSRVKVVDENGNAVGVDEVGELWIGGPHLCAGYWREESLFRQSIREGLFVTGDLVRVDAAGFFYVVGRKKEMYISGGENVYPGEVEKKLVSHADISQAVVVAVADEKWGEVGFAFLVATFTRERDGRLETLRDFLNPILARYKHPHHLKILERMPLLANGKIDRNRLRREARELARRSKNEFSV